MSPTQDFCPITGCQRTRHVTAVMCLECWARVPMKYQRQVLLTRNRVQRASKNPTLLLARMRAYRDACAVAIQCLEPKVAGVAK